MKTLTTFIAFVISLNLLLAEDKNVTLKVDGNCGMCKKRIENAVKKLDGVSEAEWNKKTKELTVSFDSLKTSTLKIEETVASVGHDTDGHKATNEIYSKLPDCCRYERADEPTETEKPKE